MTYRYRLLAETITSDDRGETVEGSNGIMDAATGAYVPMDGVIGVHATRVLNEHTYPAGDLDTLERILHHYGAPDHIDVHSDDEAIIYLADLPRVDDDEPYVRAIWVGGPRVSFHLEGVYAAA